MYNEYFNYQNCTQQQSYSNYNDQCFTTYYNYPDCEVSYHNYKDCETCWVTSYGAWSYRNTYYNYSDCEVSYHNYTDCETSYNNAVNDCNTYTNYANHIDYSNPNSGDPMSLSWESPWGGWNNDDIAADKISESVNAIKQLRHNIKHLSENKSQQNASVDVGQDSPNVGDEELDPPGPDYVEEKQWDALRDSLENLWQAIASSSSNTPDRSQGDLIKKSDWSLLKQKTDDLAQFDASSSYSNHVDYSNFSHVDYSESVTN